MKGAQRCWISLRGRREGLGRGVGGLRSCYWRGSGTQEHLGAAGAVGEKLGGYGERLKAVVSYCEIIPTFCVGA